MEIVNLPAARPSSQPRFAEALGKTHPRGLLRGQITILQINVGKLCNQACHHCHVEAGPRRTEIMGRAVALRMLELAAFSTIETVDITGGAPEMNPHFRELVEGLVEMGKEVIVRCNLTILEKTGYEGLPEFYAQHGVHLICSLPCYTSENVAKQRGQGVFEKSIRALRRLNALGFGVEGHGSGLTLDLVYNPVGAVLPPSQEGLEADYKRELAHHFGVGFNHLLALTNVPIGRFRGALRRNNGLEPYLNLLEGAFNPATVENLMCRNTLNVGWDGRIYDCDFNQMLGLEIGAGLPSILEPGFSLERLAAIPISTGDHCLACTAGAGSSCGGTLA